MVLDETIEKRVKPLLDDAVRKVLGFPVPEIGYDVSDRLKRLVLDFAVDSSVPFKKAKLAFKRHYLVRLLQKHNGNVSDVSFASGIKRESVHRLIRQLRIDVDSWRESREYVREAVVKNVLDEAIRAYESSLHPAKIKEFYHRAPSISKGISRELLEEDLSFAEAEREFECAYLARALRENGNNVSRTARKIGLRVETLFRKVKELGVNL